MWWLPVLRGADCVAPTLVQRSSRTAPDANFQLITPTYSPRPRTFAQLGPKKHHHVGARRETVLSPAQDHRAATSDIGNLSEARSAIARIDILLDLGSGKVPYFVVVFGVSGKSCRHCGAERQPESAPRRAGRHRSLTPHPYSPEGVRGLTLRGKAPLVSTGTPRGV